MLILGRKKGESVVIYNGDFTVEVTISQIRGDDVKLGFIAPRSVTIDRKEIYERKRKQKGV